MPVYEFKCRDCHHKFTLVLRLSEAEKREHAQCPKCSSKNVQRIITPFFAVTASKTGSW